MEPYRFTSAGKTIVVVRQLHKDDHMIRVETFIVGEKPILAMLSGTGRALPCRCRDLSLSPRCLRNLFFAYAFGLFLPFFPHRFIRDSQISIAYCFPTLKR